jgi:hypothetical protein
MGDLNSVLNLFGETGVDPLSRAAGIEPAGLAPSITSFLGATPEAMEKPLMPLSEKPAVMPIADDEAVRRRRRRSTAEQRARSGRASTIFTEGYGLGG